MLDVQKPYLFPVVDQESFRVLCFCLNPTIANAVSQGILNSSPMTVHYPLFGVPDPTKDYNTDIDRNIVLVLKMPDFNKIHPGGYVTSDCNIAMIVDSTPTGRFFDFIPASQTADQNWREKRKLATDRNTALELLERRCDKYLTRTTYFTGDPIFLSYIGQRLADCKPELGYYDKIICDWAEINEISPAAAYNELKMTWDSAGIATTKIHALWSKYVRKINTLQDLQKMKYHVQVEFEGEIRFGKKS